MKKTVYEVRVNDFGWNSPKTFWFESKEEAEQFADKYPASDKVKHKQYGVVHADELLSYTKDWISNGYSW